MNKLLLIPLGLLLAACASKAPPEPGPARQARVLSESAARASLAGQWRSAAAQWQEAARRHAALDDWNAAGQALLGAAQALAGQGEPAQAAAMLDGLGAARYPAAVRGEALYQRALIDLAAKDWPAGLARLAAAEALLPADEPLRAAIPNARAREAQARGDWAEMKRQAGLALAVAAIEPAERANALRLRGVAALAQGETAAARGDLDAALALDRSLARPAGIAADLAALADWARRTGDPAAEEWADRAAAVCTAAGAGCAP
ncbi:hypothetical protein [Chitinimonas koreensis]|uniref:hypothetical protein n=1 Tax=Chitinimonas koreensis TaxID=356302 RepID=UPI000424A934|nr:hypothetical protein [Chitinimonas koreensis]